MRSLSDSEVLDLVDAGRWLSAEERTLNILRLVSDESEEALARLPRARLDALLIDARAETIGPHLAACIACGECGTLLEATVECRELTADPPDAFELKCDNCGKRSSSTFDIRAFFWRELSARAQHIVLDVHELARPVHREGALRGAERVAPAGPLPRGQGVVRQQRNPVVGRPLPGVSEDAFAEAGDSRLGREARAKAERAAAGLRTPETYLGTDRAHGWVEAPRAGIHAYRDPASLGLNEFAYGGRWRVDRESGTAVRRARLSLSFQARRVFLVLGCEGGPRRLTVRLDGAPIAAAAAGEDVEDGRVTVRGQRLYRLGDLPHAGAHELELAFERGISGYAFTFG